MIAAKPPRDVACSLCGHRFPFEQLYLGVCNDCRKAGRDLVAAWIARNGPLAAHKASQVIGREIALEAVVRNCDWFECESDGWHLTSFGYAMAKDVGL